MAIFTQKTRRRGPPVVAWAGVLCAFVMNSSGTARAAEAEEAFSALKVYAENGSSFRKPVDDWEGATKRWRTEPRWTKWVSSRRAMVDDWIERRLDRTEWQAGYWHDFVSPKDGAFLRWTPDEPGANTLKSPSGETVQLTSKLKGAWVYAFRSTHAQRILESARLYRLTGVKRYGTWAASQLTFYAGNYEQWPVRKTPWGSTGRLMFHSLDEATNLILYVQAADALGDFPTESERRLWIEKLFRPEAELVLGDVKAVLNVSAWLLSAAGHVAIYANDGTLLDRVIDGKGGLRELARVGITKDFLWYEQSLGYNAYVFDGLLPFLSYASQKGISDRFANVMATVQNLMLSPLQLRFEDGRLPMPADATGWPLKEPNIERYARAYRVFPVRVAAPQIANQENWEALLDPPTIPPVAAALPEVSTRNLSDSQMGILRAGGWQIFFHYGQLTANHAQEEALNFEATFNGIDVTHDPGTVGYGSPLHVEYFRTGLAHNVPLYQGRGQDSWGRGEVQQFDQEKAIARVRFPGYWKGIDVTRELRVEDQSLADTLSIGRTTGGESEGGVSVALHLQGRIIAPAGTQSLTQDKDVTGRGFKYWTDRKLLSHQDSAAYHVSLEGVCIRLEIATTGPFSVVVASTPDAPPRRRQSLLINSTLKGTRIVRTVFRAVPEEACSAQ
jgi:hypothetical protein